jgi:hypothetical protein
MDQLLTIFFSICQILEKEWEYNETAHDSVRAEALSNTEFGVPMKLVRLIKMCLNETYSEVHIGKQLANIFPIQMV